MSNRVGSSLLVFDHGLGYGGIDRVSANLIPRIADHFDQVYWTGPHSRLLEIESSCIAAGTLDFVPSAGFYQKGLGRAARALRMIGARLNLRGANRLANTIERADESRALSNAAQTLKATHLLLPSLFTQTPPKLGIPTVAILHDLNFHPTWRAECEANLERWTASKHTIVCISEFTQARLQQQYPDLQANVVTIRNAISTPPSSDPTYESSRRLRFFYPASLNPHKGHACLIRACIELWRKDIDFELCLAGSRTAMLLETERNRDHPKFVLELQRLIDANRSIIKDRLVIEGFVSDSRIEELYGLAHCVALPTLYEGFGLPLGEACARGLPVICSAIEAFKEQVSLYDLDQYITAVPPNDVDAWSNSIELFARRTNASQSRLSRADLSKWTWTMAAKSYARLLGVLDAEHSQELASTAP